MFAQDLMDVYQSVEDGAWQACAASMMVLHSDLGFSHHRFSDLMAMFQCAYIQRSKLKSTALQPVLALYIGDVVSSIACEHVSALKARKTVAP